jgi:hypothetical protein
MSNFMNICPLGAGQTDRHEAQNRCWQSQFGNAPKLPERLSVALLIVLSILDIADSYCFGTWTINVHLYLAKGLSYTKKSAVRAFTALKPYGLLYS